MSAVEDGTSGKEFVFYAMSNISGFQARRFSKGIVDELTTGLSGSVQIGEKLYLYTDIGCYAFTENDFEEAPIYVPTTTINIPVRRRVKKTNEATGETFYIWEYVATI
jgi:hypothetical protein